MISTNKWLIGARLRTLPAAVVPVLVGTATAWGEDSIIFSRFFLALIVALSIQIATNYVNDYADGQRGTDDNRTGPKRLVSSGLANSKQVKLAAGFCFIITAFAGLLLSIDVGYELIPVGALSILAGWAYTAGSKPYGYLGLGELFVFIFFGLVATIGSYYIQTKTVSGLSFVVACVVGFLAVCLMVTNNLRDIPEDLQANKLTLAVRLGDLKTRYLYLICVLGVVLGICLAGLIRGYATIGLLATPFLIPPTLAIIKKRLSGSDLIPVLGLTARAQIAIGIVLSVGLGYH